VAVTVRQVGDGAEMRDAEDGSGPVLRFSRAEWEAFTAGVRRGDFDLPPGAAPA
jgi:hypothetical protein